MFPALAVFMTNQTLERMYLKNRKKSIDFHALTCYNNLRCLRKQYADMAELADALASGASGSNLVEVQVLLSAPINKTHPFRVCLFLFKRRRGLEP